MTESEAAAKDAEERRRAHAQILERAQRRSERPEVLGDPEDLNKEIK